MIFLEQRPPKNELIRSWLAVAGKDALFRLEIVDLHSPCVAGARIEDEESPDSQADMGTHDLPREVANGNASDGSHEEFVRIVIHEFLNRMTYEIRIGEVIDRLCGTVCSGRHPVRRVGRRVYSYSASVSAG